MPKVSSDVASKSIAKLREKLFGKATPESYHLDPSSEEVIAPNDFGNIDGLGFKTVPTKQHGIVLTVEIAHEHKDQFVIYVYGPSVYYIDGKAFFREESKMTITAAPTRFARIESDLRPVVANAIEEN